MTDKEERLKAIERLYNNPNIDNSIVKNLIQSNIDRGKLQLADIKTYQDSLE